MPKGAVWLGCESSAYHLYVVELDLSYGGGVEIGLARERAECVQALEGVHVPQLHGNNNNNGR